MSPRPGGEADKFGNRYEGAWTVARLLEVLGGHADWVRVEPLGDIGKGVEFVLRRPDGVVEAHQVKRQVGDANEWNVSTLTRRGVWASAKHHCEAGRDYHFVSMVPFRTLQELAERARNSNDFTSFIQGSLSSDLNTLFSQLGNLYGEPDVAYRVMRRFHVRLIDETELSQSNAVLAELLLEGAPGQSGRAALGEVLDSSIDLKLTAERILEALRPYELRRRLAVSRQGLAERVRAETTAWLVRVGRQLIQPVIPRHEAQQLQGLAPASERVHFLVGAAGGGKTAVLHQAVTGLLANGVPTLVLRLDRYGTLASTTDLGGHLGLDVSPVTALAAAADGQPAVLVVDQLDAVSLASGRLAENFDVVADLVTESAAIPTMHVVLGCRQFDVDNDHRIRSLRDRLEATVLSVAPLTDEQVGAAVAALGLPAAALTRHQRDVLRLPLHLTLLATVADGADSLTFANSQRLYDAYWEHKRQATRRRRETVRFGQVVDRMAVVISERQELAVPVSVLDGEDLGDDAAVLVSEQLLVRDGTRIAFFHEALFDYAFARQWTHRRESLVDFLTAGEQELFRRGQVRQIIAHLRGVDPVRFIGETCALLTSDRVRFHIKDAALGVLGGLSDPGSAEADMLLDVANDQPALQSRLWARLRTPAWFARLDAEGHVDAWLSGDDAEQSRVLNLMAGVASAAPERLAELLGEHENNPDSPAWLRWVVRFASLPASRPLFDRFLAGIRSGAYADAAEELWLSVHDLANVRPEWAVEVLEAFLIVGPAGLALDERGKVRALESQYHGLTELVKGAADGAPHRFVDALLPYVLQVMATTADDVMWEGPIPNRQFSHRHTNLQIVDLGDALINGLAAAIRSLVAADPDAARSTLEQLAADANASAQWLLYQGLIAGRGAYAGWAAELLLEGGHRFLCGLGANPVWIARQVLHAITPYVSDESFSRLQAAIVDLRFPWETPGPATSAFTLLAAMDESRLSDAGHRRLAELRRASGAEQPPEPEGIVSGWIASPIHADAAQRMSDDHWLRAMARYPDEREDFRALTGGASQLSHVLKAQVAADPIRFAHLAFHLTTHLHPAYGDAILMGLGEAEAVDDETLVFDAVAHIASFGHTENDRWLGYSLRHYFKTVPADLIERIRDRAISSTDPSDDGYHVWTDATDERHYDLWNSGRNTARGSLAESLGDLLIDDIDGSRTALVVEVLSRLARDPALPVRVCVAHVIAAAMRYARPEATEAFGHLIDTDDLLLSTAPVVRLILYLGNHEPALVRPHLVRMLTSAEADVREAGGEVAAYGAMQWAMEDPLKDVIASTDSAARKGAASMSAHQLLHTSSPAVASATLVVLAHDSDERVRKAVAEVAGTLRGRNLRPFDDVLKAVITSPTFGEALGQLLFTLEQAPDRVDALALLCAQRFVEVAGADAGDLRTSAAGDARHVGQLLIRGLAQSRTRADRAALLDVLDELLLLGAYGIDNVIGEAERLR